MAKITFRWGGFGEDGEEEEVEEVGGEARVSSFDGSAIGFSICDDGDELESSAVFGEEEKGLMRSGRRIIGWDWESAAASVVSGLRCCLSREMEASTSLSVIGGLVSS